MEEEKKSRKEFLFLLGSARSGGNTELLARHAAKSLPDDVTRNWLSLNEHPLPAFEDIRHEVGRRYEIATESASMLLNATLSATDLVIASPVYWYSVSASVKLYLDHWSGWMRVEGVEFRERMAGKRMWVVTALSDDDFSAARPLIETLRMSAEYMKMTFPGALIGYGSRPGDVLNDAASIERANSFFGSAFD